MLDRAPQIATNSTIQMKLPSIVQRTVTTLDLCLPGECTRLPRPSSNDRVSVSLRKFCTMVADTLTPLRKLLGRTADSRGYRLVVDGRFRPGAPV